MNSIGIVNSIISSRFTDKKSNVVGVQGVEISDEGLNIPTTGCADHKLPSVCTEMMSLPKTSSLAAVYSPEKSVPNN
jgi:hypothetical protein